MHQPAPDVTSADVDRIVARDFAPGERDLAKQILASYGSEEWHREPNRVRVALLKMSSGNIDRLRRAVSIAQSDYRDILAYAEYPSYMKKISPSEKDAAKRDKVIQADWEQYRAWFEKA